MTIIGRDCVVVRPGDSFTGKQGLSYVTGLTAETGGTTGICMTVATLPPGARAKAHLHRGIETAAYVIDGEAVVCFGAAMEHRQVVRAGEYSYVPADTPHIVMNASSAPCRALIAHTAPDDQQGIVLLPDLDLLV